MPERVDSRSVDPVALGQRIGEVVQAVGTRADAARIAGVSVQHLGQLMAGKTASPSAVMLARLCDASGFSLDWVMSGGGVKLRSPHAGSPRDHRFCGRLTDAIMKAYKDAGVQLDGVALGSLASCEYEENYSPTLTDDEQIEIAKQVRLKHAGRLATESLAARRRGA